MNVFEYIFAYETKKGHKGIVRADNREDAIERVNDFRAEDRVQSIVCLTDLDNDYGVIEQDVIDKAVKNEVMI